MPDTAYMLDTNIASAIIKNRPAHITRKLITIPMQNLFVSAITEAELLYGVAQKPEATKLEKLVTEFLKRVTSLPWNSRAAEAYAILRTECKKSGKSLGNLDMLIAAHAQSTNTTLITNDKAFFQLEHILTLEEWS